MEFKKAFMKCGKKVSYRIEKNGLLLIKDPVTTKTAATNLTPSKVFKIWEIK